jgi:hypothetical protein
VIVLVVLAAVAGAGLVAAGAWRLRSGRQNTARVLYRVTPAPGRAPHALPEPRRSAATLPPAGGQLHIHFHGVAPENVAAIFERQNGHDDG